MLIGMAFTGPAIKGMGTGMLTRSALRDTKYANIASPIGFATGLAAGGALGIGSIAMRTARSGLNVQGVQLLNPMFTGVTSHAYGKRGIDANNLETDGLVQKMHSNRRRA